MNIKFIVLISLALIASTIQAQNAPKIDEKTKRAMVGKIVPQITKLFRATLSAPRNLPELKTKKLDANDLEFRVWLNYFKRGSTAFFIERINGKWGGIYIRERNFPKPLPPVPLSIPKSGWNIMWERLKNQGLIILPDMYELDNLRLDHDGRFYLVEIKQGNNYRAYHYSNPQVQEFAEAEKFLQIIEILHWEFSITEP